MAIARMVRKQGGKFLFMPRRSKPWEISSGTRIDHGEIGVFGSWYYLCCIEEKRIVKDKKTEKDYKKQNVTKLKTSIINVICFNCIFKLTTKALTSTVSFKVLTIAFSNWNHILAFDYKAINCYQFHQKTIRKEAYRIFVLCLSRLWAFDEERP